MTTILSLQPHASQIGYAVFEDATLVDWGILNLPSSLSWQERAGKCLIPFLRKTMNWHRPTVIILPEETRQRMTARNRFLQNIRLELSCKGLRPVQFSRRDIQKTFEPFTQVLYPSKDLLMVFAARWFPELSGFLPDPRRPWEKQDYWVTMFDAVTLAITWLNHNND